MENYLFSVKSSFRKRKYIKDFVNNFDLNFREKINNVKSYNNENMRVNVEDDYINITVFNDEERIKKQIYEFFTR